MRISHSLHRVRAHQTGLSLIEILVVMVIAAVALLGLGAMSVNALKYNQTAYLRSAATSLAADMADRMRANLQGVLDGNYQTNFTTDKYEVNKGATPTVGCTTQPCTAASSALRDISNWYATAATLLPAPAIQITLVSPSSYQIVVGYQDSGRESAGLQLASCPSTFAAGTTPVRCFVMMVTP